MPDPEPEQEPEPELEPETELEPEPDAIPGPDPELESDPPEPNAEPELEPPEPNPGVFGAGDIGRVGLPVGKGVKALHVTYELSWSAADLKQ